MKKITTAKNPNVFADFIKIKEYVNEIELQHSGEVASQLSSLLVESQEMLELLEEITKLIDRDAGGGQTYDSFVYASGIQTKIDRVIERVQQTNNKGGSK